MYNKFNSIIADELPEGVSVHNYQLSAEYWSLFTKIVNDKIRRRIKILYYKRNKE